VSVRRSVSVVVSSITTVALPVRTNTRAVRAAIAREALDGESLALRRELGDCGGAANALNTLGVIARRHGAYARAHELLRESLALKRAPGDTWGSAYTLNTLGVAAREQGRLEEAHALHEEALALFQAVRGAPGVADALRNLALVAREQGDTERAAALVRASLRLRRGMAATLRTLVAIARDRGDNRRAAALVQNQGVLLAAEATGMVEQQGATPLLYCGYDNTRFSQRRHNRSARRP